MNGDWLVNLFRSDQNTVALFSLLTHEIYVTISFDEPLLFSNGLQPSYVTPNRDVMRGQRGVDETVLHDHKNNSTNGIRIIPPLRRDILQMVVAHSRTVVVRQMESSHKSHESEGRIVPPYRASIVCAGLKEASNRVCWAEGSLQSRVLG